MCLFVFAWLCVCVCVREQQKWSDGTEMVQACSLQRDSYIQAFRARAHTHTNTATQFSQLPAVANNPISFKLYFYVCVCVCLSVCGCECFLASTIA